MGEISNRNSKRIIDTLDFATDDNDTPGVNLAGFPILGLLVPVLNGAPNITAQVSIDGTNFYDIYETDGATAAIIIVGGAAPFFVSSDVLTPLAAYVAHLRRDTPDVLVRLHLSVAQTADRIFTWIGLA